MVLDLKGTMNQNMTKNFLFGSLCIVVVFPVIINNPAEEAYI